jgi:hypothetical protein
MEATNPREIATFILCLMRWNEGECRTDSRNEVLTAFQADGFEGKPNEESLGSAGFYANSIIPNRVKKRSYGGLDKCLAAVN